MKTNIVSLKLVFSHLLISVLCLICLKPAIGQSTSASFDCTNHNAFLTNGQVNLISHLVTRIGRNGTLYLDNNYDDSLTLILQRITQSGTTFQLVSESKSALDTNKVYRKYRQYYYGVEVETGGYSMSYISPSGPGPCVLLPQMLTPFIKTGISLSVTPSISSASLPTILNVGHIDKSELVITHSINNHCEFKLVYRTSYLNGTEKTSYVDAQNGDIIYTIDRTTGINIEAPTYTYSDVTIDNLEKTGVKFLQSVDQRISVFDQDNNCPGDLLNSNEWDSNLIPTTSASEWSNEALPEVYQAYYVASKILPFYDKLNINFKKLNVGSCTEENAVTLHESDYDEAYVYFGRLAGKPTALFDIVGHEIAHCFMFAEAISSTIASSSSLHEGVADIFGTYMERKATGVLDWVIGDDEPDVADIVDRDLANTPSEYDCFTEVENLGIGSRYARSRPMSRWFYLLSTGTQDIQSIQMEKVVGILKDAISMVASNVDYPQLMEQTLIVTEDKYGACSQEFESIARAWEAICVNTNLPKSNGIVVTCYFSLIGDNVVCEENDHTQICADGGLPNANYIFTIFGPKNTSFTSECGMQGNSQEGCACLNLTDFPKYPYYPQVLTIDVYNSNASTLFKQRFRLKLEDCLHDDPTCEQYYNLDPFQSTANNINSISNNNEIQDQTIDTKFQRPENSITNDSYLIIYDILGRKLFQGPKNKFDISQLHILGVIFIAEINRNNSIIHITKSIIIPE